MHVESSRKSLIKENDVIKSLVLVWRIVLLCFVIALSGCAGIQHARDGDILKPNQGLLAFYVVSNADVLLTYTDYAPESTVGSRLSESMIGAKGMFKIKAGKTYYVIPLDAGEYMFSKLNVYPRYAWLQATNRFKVVANSITYIGHIRLHVAERNFNLQAIDQELDMRTYLADTYPTYFKFMDMQKSVAQLRLR